METLLPCRIPQPVIEADKGMVPGDLAGPDKRSSQLEGISGPERMGEEQSHGNSANFIARQYLCPGRRQHVHELYELIFLLHGKDAIAS